MIESGQLRIIPGYLFGMAQPSMVAFLRSTNCTEDASQIEQMMLSLRAYLPPESLAKVSVEQLSDTLRFTRAIGGMVAGLQEAAGIPVLGTAQIIESGPQIFSNFLEHIHEFYIVFPTLVPRAAELAMGWLVQVLNELLPDQSTLRKEQQATLDLLLNKLRLMAPGGTNNIRFIRAAHTLGIPILPLTGGVFQYGWGVKARWFHSSITDVTSAIAVTFAKNKMVTKGILKVGGVPVPLGRQVKSRTDAVSAARLVGYPVVVKPVDLDQGVGVYANLCNDNEVIEAFDQTSKLSASVMLEPHLKGTAFRITLFRGTTVAVVQRLPAGVTGDGVSTIQMLINQANADPRRSLSSFSIMKPIVIDDEARMMLRGERLSLDTVAPAGQFIALRRAANVSTGGDAIVLPPDKIDSSYIKLARRAVALLRLDVAAVDLITQNIYRPWQEAGAAVIEVNAQPQMGTILTHLHGQLLRSYVQGNGILPAILVLGVDRAEIVRQVREGCASRMPGLGSRSSEGIFIGADRIGDDKDDLLAATRSLLIDPSVTSLLFTGELQQLQRQGLPLPFIDYLVLGNWSDKNIEEHQVLSLFRNQVRGEVWSVRHHPLQNYIAGLFDHNKERSFDSLDSMIFAIIQALGEDFNEDK